MSESKPLDLEEIEKAILNYFDIEKERLLKEERPDLDAYFAGRKDECSVMRRTIRTHLKKEIKKYIKATCEFYLKYKDKPALFSDEQFTIRWGYDRGTGTYIVDLGNEYTEYNEWLFKEAFKSVLEEKKNE